MRLNLAMRLPRWGKPNCLRSSPLVCNECTIHRSLLTLLVYFRKLCSVTVSLSEHHLNYFMDVLQHILLYLYLRVGTFARIDFELGFMDVVISVTIYV